MLEDILDQIKGYFKGVPGSILTKRRELRFFLNEGDIIRAYNDHDEHALNLLIKDNKNKKPDKSNSKLLSNLELLQKMKEAAWHLQNDRSEKATDKAVAIGMNYTWAAFEEITKDLTPTNLKAKKELAKIISDRNHHKDLFDDPASARVYNKGEAYGMEAVEGYSKLKMLPECQLALSQQINKYKSYGGNYIKLAVKNVESGDLDKVTMATAAVNLAGSLKDDFTFDQMKIVLKYAPEDATKLKIVDQLARDNISKAKDYRSENHEEMIERNVALLIEHCKTNDGQSSDSQKKAMTLLTGDWGNWDGKHYDMMSRNNYKSENKKNFYDMVFGELEQGSDHVIDPLFADTGKMEIFLMNYNLFKYDRENDRVATTYRDLISENAKGPGVLKARNHLAGKMFETVVEHYKKNEVPDKFVRDLGNTVVRLTAHALIDDSVSLDSKGRKESILRMREMVIEQNLKQARVSKSKADDIKAIEKNYSSHEELKNKALEDFEMDYKDAESALHSGYDAIAFMRECHSEPANEAAKTILQQIEEQKNAMKNQAITRPAFELSPKPE